MKIQLIEVQFDVGVMKVEYSVPIDNNPTILTAAINNSLEMADFMYDAYRRLDKKNLLKKLAINGFKSVNYGLPHSMIINIVCQELQISPDEIGSKSRKREIVAPRQIAHYFLKVYAPYLSLDRIGYMVGGVGHATVINSIRIVEDQWMSDKRFTYLGSIENIKRILDSILNDNKVQK